MTCPSEPHFSNKVLKRFNSCNLVQFYICHSSESSYSKCLSDKSSVAHRKSSFLFLRQGPGLTGICQRAILTLQRYIFILVVAEIFLSLQMLSRPL